MVTAEETGEANSEAELEARLKLSEISDFLFPMRMHLLLEIDYLKAQLAQERRRVDVLHTALVDVKRPIVARFPSLEPAKRTVPIPKGWDATRAAERVNDTREDKPQGIPQRPVAGSADSVEGNGSAA